MINALIGREVNDIPDPQVNLYVPAGSICRI